MCLSYISAAIVFLLRRHRGSVDDDMSDSADAIASFKLLQSFFAFDEGSGMSVRGSIQELTTAQP